MIPRSQAGTAAGGTTGTRRGPRPALRPGTAALVGLAASLAFIQGFGPARAVPSQGSHGPGQPPRAADGVLGEPTLTPEPADPTALPTVTPEPTEAGELPTLTPEATEMAELPTLTPDPLDPTLAPPPTTAVPPSPTRTASATPTATHTPTRLATATPTATASPSPSPTAPAVAAGSLANISTRGWVGTGDRVMIGGFIVSGAPATVVVRARSGSLATAGVPGLLPDPRLRLFSGQAVIAQNDNWQTGTCGADAPAGLRPSDPREACIAVTLDPGPYTAIVDDAGGRTGIALVEVFHAGGAGTLSNISTRGMVRLGDEVKIGGFIIRDHPRKVVVRARSGSLSAAGVPGLLPDPRLRLFSGQAVIAQNDSWQTGTCGADAPAGLRPSDPREACIAVTLDPGPYTAIVDDAGGQTGIALVEVFATD